MSATHKINWFTLETNPQVTSQELALVQQHLPMYGYLIKQSDKFIHKLKSTYNNIGCGVTSEGQSVFYIDKLRICIDWLLKKGRNISW